MVFSPETKHWWLVCRCLLRSFDVISMNFFYYPFVTSLNWINSFNRSATIMFISSTISIEVFFMVSEYCVVIELLDRSCHFEGLKMLAEQATFLLQPCSSEQGSSSDSSDDLTLLPETSSIVVLKRTHREPWEPVSRSFFLVIHLSHRSFISFRNG